MKLENLLRLVLVTSFMGILSSCNYTTSTMEVQLNPGVQSIPLVDKKGREHDLTGGTVSLSLDPILGWVRVSNNQNGSTTVFDIKVNKNAYDNESTGLSINAPASQTGQKVDISGSTTDAVVGSSTYNEQVNCTCSRTVCHSAPCAPGQTPPPPVCTTVSYTCGSQTLQCQTDQHQVTGSINFVDPASQATLGSLVQDESYSSDAGCTPVTYCPNY